MVTPALYTVACVERNSGMSCLPWFFWSKAFGSAAESGSYKPLLQTLTLCLRQAHTLQATATQRSVFLLAARGGTPCCKMSRGKKYMEAEAWAHSWWIGLFRAGSEMQWPGCKWGSPSSAELEDNGHNGGGLFCPFSASFSIYLYTFNIHRRLQLETGYWATWILINLLVDFLPPYFIRLTHPENNVGLWQ